MSRIRTVIVIPSSRSSSPVNDNDEPLEQEETTEDPIDVYERPYHILFDGITDALKLLRAKDYDAVKERLMNAQIEADEAVGE